MASLQRMNNLNLFSTATNNKHTHDSKYSFLVQIVVEYRHQTVSEAH